MPLEISTVPGQSFNPNVVGRHDADDAPTRRQLYALQLPASRASASADYRDARARQQFPCLACHVVSR